MMTKTVKYVGHSYSNHYSTEERECTKYSTLYKTSLQNKACSLHNARHSLLHSQMCVQNYVVLRFLKHQLIQGEFTLGLLLEVRSMHAFMKFKTTRLPIRVLKSPLGLTIWLSG